MSSVASTAGEATRGGVDELSAGSWMSSAHALGDPGLAPAQHRDSNDLRVADGRHLGAILIRPRAVVDQDQVELVVAEVRPLALQRGSCGLLQEDRIPAPVGRASGLES